jgi:uncharacterized protein with von Willebrand factor type A (vWA) domain
MVVAIDCSRDMDDKDALTSINEAVIAFDGWLCSQLPSATLYFVRFSTHARAVDRGELPNLTWDDNFWGTNLQCALLLGKQLLDAHADRDREMIVLLGGEPSAHQDLEDGRWYMAWPPSSNTIRYTLQAAQAGSDAGIDVDVLKVVGESQS